MGRTARIECGVAKVASLNVISPHYVASLIADILVSDNSFVSFSARAKNTQAGHPRICRERRASRPKISAQLSAATVLAMLYHRTMKKWPALSTDIDAQEYYQALINRDRRYEGVFYVGVKTTMVFCRPTCSARKPKFDHCEFFANAQQALLASYRPCKRCHPLSHPQDASPVIQQLIEAVEAHPEKRWTDADFAALSIHASTARRQFQRRFGMTFVAYARARRIGLAMEEIRAGHPVIDAQLAAGYESSSGFRDAFTRIMGSAPTLLGNDGYILKAAWVDTGLGPMLAIADDDALCLLEFVDRRGLEREIERLRQRLRAAIVPGTNAPIASITQELTAYFEGQLMSFRTPIRRLGTPFEQRVWAALDTIPLGETRTYGEIARTIERPTAFRAVARANGANVLALVIPCHRVINTNGELGGYGGGLERKQWLLQHEWQWAKRR